MCLKVEDFVWRKTLEIGDRAAYALEGNTLSCTFYDTLNKVPLLINYVEHGYVSEDLLLN